VGGNLRWTGERAWKRRIEREGYLAQKGRGDVGLICDQIFWREDIDGGDVPFEDLISLYLLGGDSLGAEAAARSSVPALLWRGKEGDRPD